MGPKRATPIALRVFAGGVNSLSGQADILTDDGERPVTETHSSIGVSQDYVVVPGQPWIDGFVAADHEVRWVSVLGHN